MEKKLNFTISDGPEFYSHEASVNFTPLQFIFDFKTVTPRIDPRSKEDTLIVLRHNVVMMDVFHAKNFHKILTDVIKRYEKDYGKIKEPDVLTKLKKQRKKQAKQSKSTKKKEETVQIKNKQSYFG